MNRKLFILLSGFICFAVVAASFAADAPKTSGIADHLASAFSLKPEQASGAAGSIFSLAKSKLSAADFAKIAGGIPEMDSLLKAAPSASSAGGGALAALAGQGGAAGLLGQFSKLGISPETAAKIVPEALNFVKGKQGEEVMNLLSKAIK